MEDFLSKTEDYFKDESENINNKFIEFNDRAEMIQDVDEYWQEELEKAILSNDIKKIEVLCTTRPQIKPRESVVKDRLIDIFINEIEYDDIDHLYGNMESVFKEGEFLEELRNKVFAGLLDKCGYEDVFYERLGKFAYYTKAEPLESDVQKKYYKILFSDQYPKTGKNNTWVKEVFRSEAKKGIF